MRQTDYEYIDSEPDEVIDVYREDIEDCADEAQLAEWFTSMYETRLRIEATIEARKLAHIPGYELTRDEESWFHRSSSKCAHLRFGMKMIENRMLALGYRVPLPPIDPRMRQIQNLERKCTRMRDLLRKHGIHFSEAA